MVTAETGDGGEEGTDPELDVTSELQRVAIRLAEAIGRPVDLDDARFRLLAHSSHDDAVDAVRLRTILERTTPQQVVDHLRRLGIERAVGWTRVAAEPELGLHQRRVCVPIRHRETLLGFVWLLDDGALDERAAELAQRAAAEAADVLSRARLSQSNRRRREQQLVLRAVGDDESTAAEALRELAAERLLREDQQPHVVVFAGATGPLDDVAAAELLRAVRRRTAAGEAACARVGGEVVALCRLEPRELARLCDALTEDRADVVVGLGAADSAPHRGWAQARWAAEVAAGPAGTARVQQWERLGALRYLVDVERRLGGLEEIEPRLAALAESAAGRELLTTLECHLDLGADARAAAQRLTLHRSSLYHRLARAEEELGISLRDGLQRLDVHLALKLARHLGALEPR